MPAGFENVEFRVLPRMDPRALLIKAPEGERQTTEAERKRCEDDP